MLRTGGYTLAETMVVLVIVCILATLAYPGFAQVLARARRTDAVAQLLEVQQAQERWRANHAAYGSLDELRVPEVTSDGAYRLSVRNADATGYTATAEVTGARSADPTCRVMQIRLEAGQAMLASGRDATAANAAAENRRCWGR